MGTKAWAVSVHGWGSRNNISPLPCMAGGAQYGVCWLPSVCPVCSPMQAMLLQPEAQASGKAAAELLVECSPKLCQELFILFESKLFPFHLVYFCCLFSFSGLSANMKISVQRVVNNYPGCGDAGSGGVLGMVGSSQHIPCPGPRVLLCSTLKTSIWSIKQLSVELFMQKGIEELAEPQEQLLEVYGWLGPDACVGEETQRDQQKHPSKGAVEDMDGRVARRDGANGFYV